MLTFENSITVQIGDATLVAQTRLLLSNAFHQIISRKLSFPHVQRSALDRALTYLLVMTNEAQAAATQIGVDEDLAERLLTLIIHSAHYFLHGLTGNAAPPSHIGTTDGSLSADCQVTMA